MISEEPQNIPKPFGYLSGIIKVERCEHHLYTSWLKMQSRPRLSSLFHKPLMHQWHYFYSLGKKRISLVELGDPYDDDSIFGGWNWEICGSCTKHGDIERFPSKEEAEKEIVKLLLPNTRWCFYNAMSKVSER